MFSETFFFAEQLPHRVRWFRIAVLLMGKSCFLDNSANCGTSSCRHWHRSHSVNLVMTSSRLKRSASRVNANACVAPYPFRLALAFFDFPMLLRNSSKSSRRNRR